MPNEFDWAAAGNGLLQVFTDGMAEYVDVTLPEVQSKLALLAEDAKFYLQAQIAGDPLAERMLKILVSTARLIGARHALVAQSKAEKIAGQVVERAMSYLVLFLRGMLGIPGGVA